MIGWIAYRATTGTLRGATKLALAPAKLHSKRTVKVTRDSAPIAAALAKNAQAKMELAAEMDAFTTYLNENAEMLAEHPEQARVANAYRAILLSRSEALRA